MKSFFSSAFFRGNRQRLLALRPPNEVIIITANGLLQRGADSTYPFAQDASFWYLTGIDEPDIILVMTRDSEFLMVPSRSASREAFDGAVANDALSKRSGIKQVSSADEGWLQLETLLDESHTLGTIKAAPAYIEQYGMYTNPARAHLAEKLAGLRPNLAVQDVTLDMSKLRVIKQPPELKAIQAAIDITIAGLQHVAQLPEDHGFTHEYQIEAALTAAFRAGGAAGHAFEPIVASGKEACTLHNVANNAPLRKGDLLLMDVGAEVEHYAADISRTISLRKPTKRQEAIHAAVIAVQEYAFSLLKPGVFIKEYEQKIEHFMGEQLIRLGLITHNDHESVRAIYPHATSHFLGLNVHDSGDYVQPLAPGMVITVEPGIYSAVEGIGVRIEDDVLITDTGIKVLTVNLPRDIRLTTL